MKYFPLFLLISACLVAGLLVSRFLISLSVGGFLLHGLLQHRSWQEGKDTLKNFFTDLRGLSVAGIFFLLLLGGIGSEDTQEWAVRLRVGLPLLLLPLAFAGWKTISKTQYLQLWAVFNTLLSLFSVGIFVYFCLHYAEIQASFKHSKAIPTPNNEHIRYSLMLCLAVFAGFDLWKSKFYFKYQFETYIYAACAVFMLFMLHLISVRSGLVAFYGISFLLICRWIFLERKFLLGTLILSAFLSAPFLAYQFVPSVRAKVDLTFYNIELIKKGEIGDYSDTQRLLSYQIAWRLANQNFWLGVGVGDLKSELEQIYKTEYPQQRFMFPHNQFLIFFAATGVLGLIWFLTCFLFPFFYQKAYRHKEVLIFYAWTLLAFMTELPLFISIGVLLYVYFLFISLKLER